MPVDFGRAEGADGVAEINGVGLAEVLFGEDGFPGLEVGGQDVAAVHAGKEAALDGWGEETAGFLDEDVVDGGLGDFAAVVQEEYVVVAGFNCGLEGLRVEGAMGGLVEVHGVAGVGALGGDADAEGVG